jgi:hypothetical protein
MLMRMSYSIVTSGCTNYRLWGGHFCLHPVLHGYLGLSTVSSAGIFGWPWSSPRFGPRAAT